MPGGYRKLMDSATPESNPDIEMVHHEENPVFAKLQAQKAKVEASLNASTPLDPGYAHLEHSYNELVKSIGKINYAHKHGIALQDTAKTTREGSTILSDPSTEQMELGQRKR